jgi:uracil-DNA glycosylase
MTETVDLAAIKCKIIEKLNASGWSQKLRGYLQSADFDNVLIKLLEERDSGNRFTPPLKYVFRAFEECPYDKLKVVIVGQDPYPYMGVADGIAFSCSLSKPQPSLVKMFEDIEHTVHQGFPTYQDPDLKRWSNQGVLMLNTALTCQIDKVGSHYHIWNDFIMYLMDMLNLTSSGLIFILMGKQAQELEPYISENHHILKTSHPASAAYSKGKWECNNVFNKANELIEKAEGNKFNIIKW